MTSAKRGREDEEGSGWAPGVVNEEMKQDGIKAKTLTWFRKGQDIITYRNACSTGGHGNAFSGA